MGFAALAAGADCAGGLLAMLQLLEKNQLFDFVFSKANIHFLKRACDDVYFICADGAIMASLIDEVQENKRRSQRTICVNATTNKKTIALFQMELSIGPKRGFISSI